jgi:iron(III) transport system permease protein
MFLWRLLLGSLLLGPIAIPLAAPLQELLTHPSAWASWQESPRLLALLRNTLLLIGGTLALALPLGIAGAVLLYRTDLPFRRLLRLVTILTLFVPLPLFTSGWQAALGSGGWLPLPSWSGPGAVWTPWSQGIGSAVWIHAVAGLPWVVLLVGQGLCWVERELEEDALTLMAPWRVLLCVTLPRAAAAVAAAALWVSLQAATEITVTDVMQVRTYAEEVYTQLVGGGEVQPGQDDALARAVAVTGPFVGLFAILVLAVASSWRKRLPARSELRTPAHVIGLGRARWPLALLTALLCTGILAMPLSSLVWRAGLAGTPPAWSVTTTWHYLLRAGSPPEGGLLLENLLLALVGGTLIAAVGLVISWAATGSGWFRGSVLVLMALAWAMPGPLIGLGLKITIDELLQVTDSHLLARLLYHGPSPLPLLWVDTIRFSPCALALLWPVIRLLPRELLDAARVDGATPALELRYVVWPLTRRPWLRTALAVAILSLGELSAGKLVATPGMPSYATEIFTQMHYGVTNELAARCLLLLLTVAGGSAVLVQMESTSSRGH